MKGFINCNKSIVIEDNRLKFGTPEDLKKERNMYKLHGFIAYPEYEVYVKAGYGAFITNIESEINTIDDLLNYYDPILKSNPYEDYRELIEKGYELVIGPGAPAKNGVVYGNGLFCKNWQEIYENEMRGISELSDMLSKIKVK